jgi:hypothetical protein
MRYRITTPIPGYTGVSVGVNFTNGVAEVTAPALLPELDDGQELSRTERLDRDKVAQAVEETTKAPALPAKSAPKAEWVAAAVEMAIAGGEEPDKAQAAAEALTKEQLIELLTPKGAQE